MVVLRPPGQDTEAPSLQEVSGGECGHQETGDGAVQWGELQAGLAVGKF